MWTIHPLSSHTARLAQRRRSQENSSQFEADCVASTFLFSFPGASLCSPWPSPHQRLSAIRLLKLTAAAKRKKLHSWCSESLLCILCYSFFTYLTRSVLVTEQAGAKDLCMNVSEHGKVSPILDTQTILSCHREEKFSRSKLESSWKLYSLTAYCLACAFLEDNLQLWKLW